MRLREKNPSGAHNSYGYHNCNYFTLTHIDPARRTGPTGR